MSSSPSFRFTASAIQELPLPGAGQRTTYRDTTTVGLELRVTASGAKSFSVRQRVRRGAVERVTIGPFGKDKGLTVEQARAAAKEILGVHSRGQHFAKQRAIKQAANRTFGEALLNYVNDHSARSKPLKERTRSDYLEMIRPAGQTGRGMHAAGRLWTIADRKLATLTSADLKNLHRRLALRGPTFAAYAMRVTRAVFNYEGIKLEDDPFARTTAKRDRIVLPVANKRKRIVPSDRVHSWWTAAASTETGDAFQLMLLTGMRHVELKQLLRCQVDLSNRSLKLVDTKNRTDHVIYLSEQAFKVIEDRVGNQEPDEPFWPGAGDPRKSLKKIVAESGVEFSAHDCRRTFATIAGGILPGYVVKHLLNHKNANDVTGDYIYLEEGVLRAAWQAVADKLVGRDESTAMNGHDGEGVVAIADGDD